MLPSKLVCLNCILLSSGRNNCQSWTSCSWRSCSGLGGQKFVLCGQLRQTNLCLQTEWKLSFVINRKRPCQPQGYCCGSQGWVSLLWWGTYPNALTPGNSCWFQGREQFSITWALKALDDIATAGSSDGEISYLISNL